MSVDKLLKDQQQMEEGKKLVDNMEKSETGNRSSTPSKHVSASNKTKGAEITFWLFMLFVASVLMTVGNKYVMKQWDYANTMTLLQNGTAVIYLLFGYRCGFLEMKAFTWQQWRIFLVSAFFLAMQILTSLKALPLVAIATVVAFRNMCTVVIAIVDYFFFGTKFSLRQILALGITTIGMVIYASRDVNFDFMGYMWLVGNSLATILNTFWNKVFITKYTRELKIQTSYGVSLIQQVETLPIVLFLAVANNEGSSMGDIMPLPFVTKIMLAATCAGGVLIGIAYPKCYSLLSGTSVVVASTANKAVSILMGMYLFGTVLNAIQIFGLLVCIAGSLWYALEGKR